MIRLVEDAAVEDVDHLKFSGEIDFRSAPAFRVMLRTKAKAQCPRLVLDLSEVDYIDSSGMGALVEYQRDSHKYGGEFALAGLQDRLMEIFRLVHLDEHLHIFRAVEEAHEFFDAKAG